MLGFAIEMQSSVDNDIVNMRTGVQPLKRSKKVAANQKRIFNGIQHYRDMDLLDYLDFVMDL